MIANKYKKNKFFIKKPQKNIIFREKGGSVGTGTGRDGAPQKGSLVNVTKNSSSLDSKELFLPVQDGLAQLVQRVDDELIVKRTAQETRAERWALKSVVNEILPSSRTEKCMRLRAPIAGHGLSTINVKLHKESSKAFYTGLLTCGSVWLCPVCAAKIAERRRVELIEALETAKSLGYQVNFITLTNPHGIGDDLKIMRDLQKKALTKMSSGRYSVKSQLAEQGIESYGFIRATEITHGSNGWHPHFHVILFTSKCDIETIRSVYLQKWQVSCVYVGLPRPSDEHGCHVQDGSHAAKYASKWGLEDEMTKANTKVTKLKGKSPWGLLKAVLDNDDPDYSTERATNLFRVYAKCMKGSRQLHWSVGLRKLLVKHEELTDEQLAALETDEPSVLLTSLSAETWSLIRKFKYEAHILTAAEASYKNKTNLIQPVLNMLKDRNSGGLTRTHVHTYTQVTNGGKGT